MTIRRVDFIAFVVTGGTPLRSRHDYKPAEWTGWTCALEGRDVVLRGPDRMRIDVPRAHAVIYSVEEPTPAKGAK